MRDLRWKKAALALFALLFGVILVTFLDYGVTWDEEHSRTNGELAWNWYATGFKDRRAVEGYDFHNLYGSFYNLLWRGATAVSPVGPYEMGHLLSAIFGLSGVAAIYLIGADVSGPLAGFACALLLALTPVYYGHSFNNPKDIPLAVLFLWSIYFLLRTQAGLPKPPRRALAALGAAIGLAMAVRIGGIILFGYAGFFWLAWALLRKPAVKWGKALPAMLGSGLLVVAVAWVTMLPFWPYAQLNPLTHPFLALKENLHFNWVGGVFYRGAYVPSNQLPWHYLPTWFGISLPEFYFVALGAGACLAARRLLSRRKLGSAERAFAGKCAVLALGFLFPPGVAILSHSEYHDAFRHFLFALPPLTALAGISLARAARSDASPWLRNSVLALAAASCALTAIDMLQLHPYQYLYFNRLFAGGLKEASARYETDYWGDSYKEGVDWLVRNYRRDRPGSGQGGKITVSNCSAQFQTTYPISRSPEALARFEPVSKDNHPDIFLATTRWGCNQLGGKTLHVVERQGTPLMYVLEMR